MAKLNPPYIENILPPFTTDGNIVIPFEFNRTTISNDIDKNKVKILIKNPLSNVEIKPTKEIIGTINLDEEKKINTMNFQYPGNFKSGQYYKIQVAFVQKDTEEVGYYSSIGIARCIEAPEVKIEGENTLADSSTTVSNMGYKYRGICTLKEPTEKIYSYYFSLINSKTKEIVYTTGEKIHDTSKDISSTESVDTCYIPAVLDFENEYQLNYSITTINGYKKSATITIKSGTTINLSMGNNVLIAEPDYENGTIVVKFEKKNIKQDFTPIFYNFILLRSSSKDNFLTWDRISILDEDNSKNLFKLENALLIGDSQILWEDATVEHGIFYKYAIQAYNSFGLLSNKVESNLQQEYAENGMPMYSNDGTLLYTSIPVQINFEDMFLNDGKQQLRIRFNPKVSSFKNTVLESKLDTIGSKYPFFFRNGTVKYKEFPISGLISLLMDPDDKFKVGLYNIQKGIGTQLLNGTKTDLTHENIKNEREFKLEVLDWLTDGQPKIFRSPAEGNYLVRLMNTSLSPNDTLGRMLHTFSCTAYEIDDYNFEVLHKYGFINCEIRPYKLASFIGEKSVKLSKKLNQETSPVVKLPGAYKVTIHESKPYGAIYNIGFSDGENIKIQVGKNGVYEIPMMTTANVTSISWENWGQLKQKYLANPIEYNDASFKVNYSYYDEVNLTNFHFIQNITYTPAVVQHIGEFYFVDPNNFNNWELNDKGNVSPPNQVSTLATWGVREIDKLYNIRIKRRPLIPLYSNGNILYFNKELTDEFSLENERFLLQGLYILEPDSNGISEILDYANYEGITLNENGDNIIIPKILSSTQEDLFDYTFNEKTFSLNLNNLQGNIHDINNKYEYTVFELDTNLLQNTTVEKLTLGSGLMMEIVYLAKDLHYNFENYYEKYKTEVENIKYTKDTFGEKEKLWKEVLVDKDMNILEYFLRRKNYESAYKKYVTDLKNLVLKLTANEEVIIT